MSDYLVKATENYYRNIPKIEIPSNILPFFDPMNDYIISMQILDEFSVEGKSIDIKNNLLDFFNNNPIYKNITFMIVLKEINCRKIILKMIPLVESA